MLTFAHVERKMMDRYVVVPPPADKEGYPYWRIEDLGQADPGRRGDRADFTAVEAWKCLPNVEAVIRAWCAELNNGVSD
jgi:hypothetical protein